MKKFLAIFLVLALAMTAMAGCGGTGGDSGESADVTKIGFLYIGPVTDGGYNQAQHAGAMAVQEELGDSVKVLWAENVAEDLQAVKTNAIKRSTRATISSEPALDIWTVLRSWPKNIRI